MISCSCTFHLVLSCSRISETEQSKIKQRVSRVFVVMASPFLMRRMVLAEIPCLKIN